VIKVLKVVPQRNNKLIISFSDGRCGVCDLSDIMKGPQFAPLSEDSYFNHVAVDEQGAIFWPHGLDLCPDFLYQIAKFD
jgi:hypothetical protein